MSKASWLDNRVGYLWMRLFGWTREWASYE